MLEPRWRGWFLDRRRRAEINTHAGKQIDAELFLGWATASAIFWSSLRYLLERLHRIPVVQRAP
jgi:hypothetical protein